MGYIINTEHRNTLTDNYKRDVVLRKSNHSYLVNNKITEKFDSNSWKGQRCFIVGGGESIKNFDFSNLEHENVIGINKAFKYIQRASINYSMDSTFYEEMKRGDFGVDTQSAWKSFEGVRVFLTPLEFKDDFGKEVYLVRRNMDLSLNMTDLDNGIYGGTNSGTGAITLAIALGSKEIFLLGYDMKAVHQTHFHDGYPNRNIDEFNNKLGEYRQEITRLHPLIHQTDVKVTNLNRDSGLRCFPFSDFETIVQK